MAGGTMQLLFKGQQDIYLTSNPSISFFKRIYRTHTNFSMESIAMTFDNTVANIYQSTTFKAKIKRHGDLAAQIYFVMEFPDIISDNIMNFRWIDNLGEAAIESCHVSIGGSIIDRQTGELFHARKYLSKSRESREIYDKMIGNVWEMTAPENYNIDTLSKFPVRYRIGANYPVVKTEAIQQGEEDNFQPSISRRKLYIPLQFWFTDVGNALPLVSLQYSEVEISVTIRPIAQLYKIFYRKDGVQDYFAPSPGNAAHKLKNFVTNSRQRYLISDDVLDVRAYMEVNYIYLDKLERKYFAYKPLEYLIQQHTRIERIGLEQNNVIEFVLQNPVKEIIWFCRRDNVGQWNNWLDFTDGSISQILKTAKFMFNGVDRIEEKDAEYFNWLQPYQHHTGPGKSGLYCYCFSMYPDEYQPSGSVNMSRISKVQCVMRVKKTQDTSYKYDAVFYVVNYNILKVMSGLASVAYAL